MKLSITNGFTGFFIMNYHLELDPNKVLSCVFEGKIYYEEFVDIIDYEGYYQISTFGRVKSLNREVSHYKGGTRKVKERIITQTNNIKDYFFLSLSKNNIRGIYRTHILVAVAFLNHKPNGYKIVCDHVDNIRTHNFYKNLQIITQRENSSKDQWRRDRSSGYIGVVSVKGTKRWNTSITFNGVRKHLGNFSNEIEASKYYQNALICVRENRIKDIKVKTPNYSSKYKGVSWFKRENRWVSRIWVNSKHIRLGSFKNEYDAHLLYDKAAKYINLYKGNPKQFRELLKKS